MKTLKIFTSQEKNFDIKKRYRGTYLHGQLEDKKGYDIFSFERKQQFKEGIHEIKIDGEDCSFFLWKSGKLYDWRGFLILSKDQEARKHALKHYLNKTSFL
jgi:hypothetical protein